MKDIANCNWQVGLKKAYEGSVFITPQIDDWILACGMGLPDGSSLEGVHEVKELLKRLSLEFGEAQFFGTHRVVEYHCWMKAINGKIERVYSYLGEAGENIVIEGKPIQFEEGLNLANTFSEEAKDNAYFERKDITWADEQLVMQIAEQWSINPTQLSERQGIEPGLGLLGER